jgi:hypothetical protein
MPKLADLSRRPSKKVILPSSTKEDEAWVEIYTEALTGDLEEVGNVGDQKGFATVTGIKNLIKAWNFEEEEGKVAEITIDNVRRLKQTDVLAIIEEVGKMRTETITDESKKKTS